MKRINGFFKKNLIWEFVATGLSVLCLEYLFIFSKFSSVVNWEMVICDSISGLISYWLILGVIFFIMKEKYKSIELLITVHLVIFGSVVWALCHAVYLIYFDYRYLSDIRPETFYDRHLWIVENAFLYFAPIFSISSLIFIVLLRIVKKTILNLLEMKLS